MKLCRTLLFFGPIRVKMHLLMTWYLFWLGKKFLIKVCLIIPPAWHGQMVTRVIKLKPYDGPNSGLMFFFFIRVSHFYVMFAILKLFHG